METAAAAMLEAGVGRFSRAPALVAEMWAPLAVVLAALLAMLPSLLRRLQGIVLRLRSRGKEAIQSRISTCAYCSSSSDDDDDYEGVDTSSDDEAASSDNDDEEEEEEKEVVGTKRIGYLDEEDGCGGGCFPWGGSVVRTWQDLPRRFPSFAGAATEGARFAAAPVSPAVRLWGASGGGEPWWSADEGATAEEVVAGWRRRRDHRVKRRVVTPSTQRVDG